MEVSTGGTYMYLPIVASITVGRPFLGATPFMDKAIWLNPIVTGHHLLRSSLINCQRWWWLLARTPYRKGQYGCIVFSWFDLCGLLGMLAILLIICWWPGYIRIVAPLLHEKGRMWLSGWIISNDLLICHERLSRQWRPLRPLREEMSICWNLAGDFSFMILIIPGMIILEKKMGEEGLSSTLDYWSLMVPCLLVNPLLLVQWPWFLLGTDQDPCLVHVVTTNQVSMFPVIIKKPIGCSEKRT